MSWMRWPVYAWGDGRSVHLWSRTDAKEIYLDPHPDDLDGYGPEFEGGIAIKQSVFDALALMRVAELLCDEPDNLKRAMREVKRNGGNFGAWTLRELLGDDPGAEMRARMEKVSRG